jgi:hypothetical protein
MPKCGQKSNKIAGLLELIETTLKVWKINSASKAAQVENEGSTSPTTIQVLPLFSFLPALCVITMHPEHRA